MKKIMIWIIALILLSSIALADLNPQFRGAFIMEEASTPLINRVNESVNATQISVPIYQSNGINNFGVKLDGTDDAFDLDDSLLNGMATMSISCWFNVTNVGSTREILGFQDSTPAGTGYVSIIGGNLVTRGLDVDGECGTNTGSAVSLNSWNNVVFVMNGSHALGYLNGTLDTTGSGCDKAVAIDNGIFLGQQFGGANNFIGNLDECYIWDRALNQTEVTELQTTFCSGSPCSFAAPPVSSSIDLLFSNITETLNYKTIFDEGENFNIFINLTNSTGESLNNSNCNISVQNGIVEIEGDFDNFSLCDSGCDFSERSKVFNISNTTAINDSIHFNGCHEQTATGNIDINFTCGVLSEIITVEAAEMPLCSLGTAFVRKTTDLCIGAELINISTETAGNIPFSQRKRILNTAFDREYSVDVNVFGIGVFHNDTLDLFQNNHTHEFYEHGSKTIWANCSNVITDLDNSVRENITIVNAAPINFIEQFISPSGIIYNLTNGSIIEFENGNWTLLMAVIDDDLFLTNVSIINSSSDVVVNNTDCTINLCNISSDIFNNFADENNYIINLFSNDTLGLNANTTLTFIFNDTAIPTINHITPSNGSIISIDVFNLLINLTDESLFNYQFNITNCGSIVHFNFTNTNLNGVTNFQVSETVDVTTLSDGTYCIDGRVSDGHTLYEIEDYVYKRNLTEKKLSFNYDIDFEFEIDVAEIYVDKDTDRYRFGVRTFKKNNEMEIIISSEDYIYILEESKYKGHLIIDKYWIDFEDEDILFTKVYRIDDNSIRVYIKYKKDKDTFMFNSIGEFNIISSQINFNIDRADRSFFDFSLINLTIAQVVFLALLFIIGLGILVYAEVLKSFVFLSIAGMFYSAYGVFMVTISPIFAMLIIGVAILIMFRAVELRLIERRG